MSHISEIRCEIKDLDALADAAAALGGTLNLNTGRFKAYFDNAENRSDHSISFPNSRYEIGVVERGDHEGYTLKCDWFSTGNLQEIAGTEGAKLVDEYNAAVVWRHYSQQGYNLNRYQNDAGEIVLEASK